MTRWRRPDSRQVEEAEGQGVTTRWRITSLILEFLSWLLPGGQRDFKTTYRRTPNGWKRERFRDLRVGDEIRVNGLDSAIDEAVFRVHSPPYFDWSDRCWLVMAKYES